MLGAPWGQRDEVTPLELAAGKHQFTVELELADTLTPSGKVCVFERYGRGFKARDLGTWAILDSFALAIEV